MICTAQQKYYSADQINKNEMNGACRTCEGGGEVHTGLS